jgi:exonuclease III
MKILYWNIRGLGALGRRKQLRERRHKHRVGAICLQETIKKDFSVWDLQALSEGETFDWCWTAAVGHSGGTLTGVKLAGASVVGKDRGVFFSSMTVISKEDNFKWELINVYGPVQIERKSDFIQELNHKLTSISWPYMVGGI